MEIIEIQETECTWQLVWWYCRTAMLCYPHGMSRHIKLMVSTLFWNLPEALCATGPRCWSHGTDGSTESCSGDAEEVDFWKPFGAIFKLPEAWFYNVTNTRLSCHFEERCPALVSLDYRMWFTMYLWMFVGSENILILGSENLILRPYMLFTLYGRSACWWDTVLRVTTRWTCNKASENLIGQYIWRIALYLLWWLASILRFLQRYVLFFCWFIIEL